MQIIFTQSDNGLAHGNGLRFRLLGLLLYQLVHLTPSIASFTERFRSTLSKIHAVGSGLRQYFTPGHPDRWNVAFLMHTICCSIIWRYIVGSSRLCVGRCRPIAAMDINGINLWITDRGLHILRNLLWCCCNVDVWFHLIKLHCIYGSCSTTLKPALQFPLIDCSCGVCCKYATEYSTMEKKQYFKSIMLHDALERHRCYIITCVPQCNTRSSAVAKRPRDASHLYSFNTKRRVQSFIISCFGFRYTTAYN